MIALWTLNERCFVVIVRSEYFSESKRLPTASVRPLVRIEDMLDRDPRFTELYANTDLRAVRLLLRTEDMLDRDPRSTELYADIYLPGLRILFLSRKHDGAE